MAIADKSIDPNKTAGQARAIAFILKGYPRLSETFIAQEILALEKAGMELRIVSMRQPTDKQLHPVHDEITAPVNYLPEYLYNAPIRVLKSWLHCRKLPGYRQTLRKFLSDLKSDLTPNRIRRFGQALVLATELPNDCSWLHAHFIHTPASVTQYTSLLTGLGWSCSAHAKDIWTSRATELTDKLVSARWTVTCTQTGHEHLQSLADRSSRDQVHLVYHGLDFDRFPPPPETENARDGADSNTPVQLLTVGRAVPKKGIDILLDALAMLPDDLHWHWTHIGGGDLLDKLTQKARDLNIASKCTWKGALQQEQVLAAYRNADIFVLPCRISTDGDRDGLPNVLVEAQSQRLMCISTTISGVPELIDNDQTGILVEPENAVALAAQLKRAITNPDLRRTLGNAGAQNVREKLNHHAGISQLLDLFSKTDPALVPDLKVPDAAE